MAGVADVAALKKAQRRGRERGCWVYIAGEQLEAMGLSPDDPPPLYRVWGASDRPRAVMSLYPQPKAEPVCSYCGDPRVEVHPESGMCDSCEMQERYDRAADGDS